MMNLKELRKVVAHKVENGYIYTGIRKDGYRVRQFVPSKGGATGVDRDTRVSVSLGERPSDDLWLFANLVSKAKRNV